jgi:UDP-N-acetylmuramoylalanine--D-glutamate ligase
LGGNIGTPPLEFLPKLTKDSKVVLELSSFQLMDLGKSPHVAVMLMTTSEHLDYHKDIYEYINAKRNIFRFQNEADFAVVNKDYPASNESDIESMGKVYRVSREQGVDQGCFVRGESIVLKMGEEEEVILSTNDIALPGKHNLENVCAAIVAALCAGCTMKSIIPVLKKFQGLPHRIEFIRLVNGVKYYNDSFSTTPETSIAAIEAFEEPKILILGGSSKKSDFSELGKVIRESKSMKAIIGIGLEWAKIKESISHQPSGVQYVEGLKTMEEIVDEAARLGTVGDVVLLSPGCASFDMFKSYKDRGEQFKAAVQAL